MQSPTSVCPFVRPFVCFTLFPGPYDRWPWTFACEYTRDHDRRSQWTAGQSKRQGQVKVKVEMRLLESRARAFLAYYPVLRKVLSQPCGKKYEYDSFVTVSPKHSAVNMTDQHTCISINTCLHRLRVFETFLTVRIFSSGKSTEEFNNIPKERNIHEALGLINSTIWIQEKAAGDRSQYSLEGTHTGTIVREWNLYHSVASVCPHTVLQIMPGVVCVAICSTLIHLKT